MEKTNFPELEVEKLMIKKDGRGFLFHESGRMTNDWTGFSCSGETVGGRHFLCAASSAGWLKIHVVSGSTYGPTGASYYVPIFKSRDTTTS